MLLSGRKAGDQIRSLVKARGLQLEWAKLLHEALPMPDLLYGSETMIWREENRSKIRDVHLDIMRGLLGEGRVHRKLDAWIRELYGVMKGVGENVL